MTIQHGRLDKRALSQKQRLFTPGLRVHHRPQAWRQSSICRKPRARGANDELPRWRDARTSRRNEQRSRWRRSSKRATLEADGFALIGIDRPGRTPGRNP